MLNRYLTAASRISGIIVCLLASACADDIVDLNAERQSTLTDTGKADTLHGESAGEMPVLASQYALVLNSWIELVDGPDDDEPSAWDAAFFALMHTAQNSDGQLFVEAAPCSMILPEVDDRKVESSDETLQRAIPSITAAKIELKDGAFHLVTERDALLAGVDLDDSVGDEMPSNKRDDRVVDIDDDRKPGMTLRISGFKVYVGLRYTYSLNGVIGDDGVIEGEAEVHVDMEVYGDNVPFVDIKKHFDRSFGKLSLTNERHQFQMIPLDDDVSFCPDVPQGLFVQSPITESDDAFLESIP